LAPPYLLVLRILTLTTDFVIGEGFKATGDP
jgi:hypothetical protein